MFRPRRSVICPSSDHCPLLSFSFRSLVFLRSASFPLFDIAADCFPHSGSAGGWFQTECWNWLSDGSLFLLACTSGGACVMPLRSFDCSPTVIAHQLPDCRRAAIRSRRV